MTRLSILFSLQICAPGHLPDNTHCPESCCNHTFCSLVFSSSGAPLSLSCPDNCQYLQWRKRQRTSASSRCSYCWKKYFVKPPLSNAMFVMWFQPEVLSAHGSGRYRDEAERNVRGGRGPGQLWHCDVTRRVSPQGWEGGREGSHYTFTSSLSGHCIHIKLPSNPVLAYNKGRDSSVLYFPISSPN